MPVQKSHVFTVGYGHEMQTYIHKLLEDLMRSAAKYGGKASLPIRIIHANLGELSLPSCLVLGDSMGIV